MENSQNQKYILTTNYVPKWLLSHQKWNQFNFHDFIQHILLLITYGQSTTDL